MRPQQYQRPREVTHEVGGQVIDVDEEARLVTGVSTREADEGARAATATAGNCDLSTRDVELGTVGLSR
jgi:hypothetical protein